MKMDEKFNPKVSICIPAFRSAAYIHRAIESCLNQSYRNIEIIVSDDNSPDGTEKAVRRFASKDSRVKYFRNEANLGGMRNFFRAMELASSEYIQPLCDDDWLSRECVADGLKELESHPETAAAWGGVVHLDMDSKGLFHSQAVFNLGPGIYPVKPFLVNGYRSEIGPYSGFAMYRRKDLLDAKPLMMEVLDDANYPSVRKFGFWGEALLPLKILSRYMNFACTGNIAYVKVEHSTNNAAKIYFPTSILERIALSVAVRNFYEMAYKKGNPDFLRRFRMDFGSREIVDILVSAIKGRFSSGSLIFFLRKGMPMVIGNYSILEKIQTLLRIPLPFALRTIAFAVRKLKGRPKYGENKNVDYLTLFLGKTGEASYSFIYDGE